MTPDRLIAVAAFLGLTAFIGVIIYFVPQTDLVIVCVAVLLMAGYDLWITSKPAGSDKQAQR